jgi:hypothetical protein
VADETAADRIAPPSEEVHLPEPSYLPALVALGVTIALVGVILSWAICGLGAVIAVVAIARWIRQTREEMAELPLEH